MITVIHSDKLIHKFCRPLLCENKSRRCSHKGYLRKYIPYKLVHIGILIYIILAIWNLTSHLTIFISHFCASEQQPWLWPINLHCYISLDKCITYNAILLTFTFVSHSLELGCKMSIKEITEDHTEMSSITVTTNSHQFWCDPHHLFLIMIISYIICT